MTTRLAALEPRAALDSRGARRIAVPAVLAGFAILLAIGAVEPLVWPLVVLLGSGVVAGAVGANATRARHRSRLEAELIDTVGELRRSRARVAHVADTERRRIERDLHDGCQQRLIALRVKLSLAEEILGEENRLAGELIHEIAADAETALADLHALVHGIYPALLTDRGLRDAVKAMARAAPIPARVLAEGVARYPPDLEAAVYFTCAEALQNAAKHGGPGVTARIAIRQEPDGLVFEIRDDGRGFDTPASRGSGIANMEDRLAAVGGRLKVVSAPGCGAAVQGCVPAAAPAS